MKPSTTKSRGIHYTPPELARFLARHVADRLRRRSGELHVLDPACGDGALLAALAAAVPAKQRRQMHLVGYETDRSAIEAAARVLRPLGTKDLSLIESDFLVAVAADSDRCMPPASDGTEPPAGFDAIIANPPYVRTQVLGARRAGLLAAQFSLTGRVDLYQAFARAMARVLRPGGVLGLLTSNRFLTVKSGAALREMLRREFTLEAVYDLGDTKLFAAAVLPVIVVAIKRPPPARLRCRFDRVYRARKSSGGVLLQAATEIVQAPPTTPSLLAALADGQTSGCIETPSGRFRIERGVLSDHAPGAIWTLSNADSDAWLKVVRRHIGRSFDDVGRVRVGIKTTADEVFIRDDWHRLPPERRPECELLRPLLRHFGAARWRSGAQPHTVLYPHVAIGGRRKAVDLDHFPCARRYLAAHRGRLTRRQYVVDSGREWYEIWVPHNPGEWSLPKIVFPDIADQPRFFLDRSGAVVNGDCYWITLRAGQDLDWLLLMLAVANSSFIVRYYDIAFHNQLYAGRRRFMTQYVKQFPLPDIDAQAARAAIEGVRRLVDSSHESSQPSGELVLNKGANLAPLEQEVDALVWRAFGLPVPRAGM
ncbi:MAG TPA: N-6 DNA methylase [Pirellulales bacterium]|nr:N-6 DNA methylase [Pirellulales bacterium]